MAENEIQAAVGGGGGGGNSCSVAITVAKLRNKKIHKLPPHLRSKNDGDVYDPTVVSLGPYHQRKPELQLLEGIKYKVLDNFTSGGGSSKNFEFYFKKMMEVVDAARSCYIMENNNGFDDSQFAEMMLLDGCFLPNYILITTDYGDDVDNNKAVKCYSAMDTALLIDAAAGYLFTLKYKIDNKNNTFRYPCRKKGNE